MSAPLANQEIDYDLESVANKKELQFYIKNPFFIKNAL